MIKFTVALRHRPLSSIFGIAVLIGGCPKRQTAPRLVYIPAPPAATEPAPSQSTEALVIEEPPPPSTPQETVPAVLPAPKPPRRPRHAGASEPPESNEVAPEPEEPPPPPSVPVPALQPSESREAESALRTRILALQNEVAQQIAQLAAAQLTSADRKTLDDAGIFLGQSRKALEEPDLQRSLNLARKASLLVAALNKH